MAFRITKTEIDLNQTGVHIEAVLDAASDLDALKASGTYAPGSHAIVADASAELFMVNASGEWKAMQ